MNIDSVGFSLKSPRCECCNNQGALCFATCPRCKSLVLICEEVGTVFLNPLDLKRAVYGGMENPNCMCIECRDVHVSDFENSTTHEIQTLGFDVSEFELHT